MQAADLLQFQLRGSCQQVSAHAQDARDVWTERAFPGASLPGFVAWHCARIVDWGVHTVVREAPEIASTEPWRDRVRFALGHGAGLSDEEADGVARDVGPEDVAAYAEAVGEAIDGWASRLTADDLDRVPDLRRANSVHPRYTTEAAWMEIEGLSGVPVGLFLARPCVSHIRVHLGEIETLCKAARAAASAGA